MITIKKSILLTIGFALSSSACAMNPCETTDKLSPQLQQIVQKTQNAIAAMRAATIQAQLTAKTAPSTPPSQIRTGIPQTPNAPHDRADHICDDSSHTKKRGRHEVTFSDDENEQPAPKKSPTISQKFIDRSIVLAAPNILPTIFEKLQPASLASCRLVCKNWENNAAPIFNEKCVAKQLAQRKLSPISYVLREANGQKTVRLYFHDCSTENLILDLLEIADPLNEITEFGMPTGLKILPSLQDKLANLINAKPINSVSIYHNYDEANVIARLDESMRNFPRHMIALHFGPNESEDFDGEINPALIERLRNYPIIRLECSRMILNEGVFAAIAQITSLREIRIKDCQCEDSEISDELCLGLPLLTVLEIINSHVATVAPAIDTLTHLCVLDLSDNEIQDFPPMHHLINLKVLRLSTGDLADNFLNADQLATRLPAASHLRELELAFTGNQSPIPANCHLNQLKTLTLDGSPRLLVDHFNELKKLKNLTMPDINQPLVLSWVTKLPALQSFTTYLNDNLIIKISDFKKLASLEHCELFDLPENLDADDMNQADRLRNIEHLIDQINTIPPNVLTNLSAAAQEQYHNELEFIKQVYGRNYLKSGWIMNLMQHPEINEPIITFITRLLQPGIEENL